jgi:UDP-glucose 4-epimerase
VRQEFATPIVQSYIGDVRDSVSVDDAVRGVDYIFHAAALKQVPTCEFFPMQAVQTNVQGTDNVLKSALRNKVKKVVVLSTDKAVYPINAMGISKAMMEKVAIANSRSCQPDQTITVTRYGNVLASRGSVLPLFFKQALKGHDITITDPNMSRFLMSLEDSVTLVNHAFSSARNGDINIQRAPGALISTIAEAVIEITNSKSKIRLIGTRHGEKLYETLASREEIAVARKTPEYYQIPCDNRGLNYELYTNSGNHDIAGLDDYNSHNTERLAKSEVVNKIRNLAEFNKLAEI